MPLKIWVDHGVCTGSQRCVFRAPELFVMDGLQAVLLDPAPRSDDDEEALIAVADLCPNQAIIVERDGQVLAGDCS